LEIFYYFELLTFIIIMDKISEIMNMPGKSAFLL